MEEVRLNKYLSVAGVCSRREADRLIHSGEVTVDGKLAVNGMKVAPGQQVEVKGERLLVGGKKVKEILLAVYKPRGVVTTTSDKDRAPNIVDLVGYKERIYPIGRLDKDSEGLILMTNQGDLVNKMMRSGNAHEKEYLVTVDRPVTDVFLGSLRRGVPILDTVTRACTAERTGEKSFQIILTQGLNRQIRRMCEYLGFQVKTLKRVRVMNIELGELKPGQYRPVTPKEYERLLEAIKDSTNLSYKESLNGRKDS